MNTTENVRSATRPVHIWTAEEVQLGKEHGLLFDEKAYREHRISHRDDRGFREYDCVWEDQIGKEEIELKFGKHCTKINLEDLKRIFDEMKENNT